MASIHQPEVLELVHHLRDDGKKLQPLINALEELSSRVQIADVYNAGLGAVSVQTKSRASFRRGASSNLLPAATAANAVAVAKRHPKFWNGVPTDVNPPSVPKVTDAFLPIPPSSETMGGLPPPEDVHDWDALQAAVNDACSSFTSPAAKAAWKKWALNPANVSLMVSLFWWIVADVFKPDHVQAHEIKAFAFSHFARHYCEVIRYRGVSKDLYLDLWQKVMTCGIINLMKESYPRSAHKFDADLEGFIQTQLLRLTAGSLPADVHPSINSQPGARLPAVLVTHLPAASTIADDFPVPPPPPPLQEESSGGTIVTAPSAISSGPPGAVSRASILWDPATLNPATLSTSHEQPPGPGASTKVVPHAVASASEAAQSRQPSQPRQSVVRSRQNPIEAASNALGFHTMKPSPVLDYILSSHGLGDPRTGEAAVPGLRTDKVGGGPAQPALRRPLDEEEGDVLSYAKLAKACKSRASEAVAKYEASKKAATREVLRCRKEWISTREHINQRATDRAQGGKAREMSDKLSHYRESDIDKMARAGRDASFDAPTSFPVAAPAAAALAALVKAVESGSTEAGSTTTSGRGRRGHRRGASSAPPAAGGQGLGPSASELVVAPALPAYLASTASVPGCPSAARRATEAGQGSQAVASTSFRLMAPWSKMRSIQAGVSAALDQGRHNSIDVAARVQALPYGNQMRVPGWGTTALNTGPTTSMSTLLSTSGRRGGRRPLATMAAGPIHLLTDSVLPPSGDRELGEGMAGPLSNATSMYSASGAISAEGGTAHKELGSWVEVGAGRRRGQRKGEAEAGRKWRPSPVEFSRGTHDTRLRKAARSIMQGMDLEIYYE
ncbi:hypothetical protein CEUSTIGMA_g7930.t1 [Chlamydomonas eustigma]|uniref:Uncharacterized protein n=1 Tax=Chlamydomonas eustigma TaxID=1157962 RepID=A0A250XC95_9CHLO|nr:hypothetical protein CEUSTIGMA_g7930.t1 [Chlamydomonas eustigma]|eukprot:GAX80492.1 hypothetical protein CEUSTIGMA_g7930.t1 [Chlamydomonas eustigma]